MNKKRDQALGMDCTITRRDFLNGCAVTVGASLAASSPAWLEAMASTQDAPEKDPGYYPPAKTGMRGSHDGSWEVAHEMRDGQTWADAVDEKESYDLVVVGGGISGLASAYFFRKLAGPRARILVLDNHDDFGGHAKRNEFRSGQRLLLGYGGNSRWKRPITTVKKHSACCRNWGSRSTGFRSTSTRNCIRAWV
jgi:spermidine dehydrogenase